MFPPSSIHSSIPPPPSIRHSSIPFCFSFPFPLLKWYYKKQMWPSASFIHRLSFIYVFPVPSFLLFSSIRFPLHNTTITLTPLQLGLVDPSSFRSFASLSISPLLRQSIRGQFTDFHCRQRWAIRGKVLKRPLSSYCAITRSVLHSIFFAGHVFLPQGL